MMSLKIEADGAAFLERCAPQRYWDRELEVDLDAAAARNALNEDHSL